MALSRRQTNQTFNMKQLASSPGHTHSPSLQKWLHSDQAFTPDNDNKTEIKVNIMDSGGVVSYELHERRYWARPTLHAGGMCGTGPRVPGCVRSVPDFSPPQAKIFFEERILRKF